MSYHITNTVPVGTDVLSVIWPSGGYTGRIALTSLAAREQGFVEVHWDDKGGENPCLEQVCDVILDTPGNREFLKNNSGRAWAAPGVVPPVLDTL